MQWRTEPSSPLQSEEYLAAVEELTQELKRSITAVTTGALSDFEDSLVRQRISCTRLLALRSQSSATAVTSKATTFFDADPVLANRLSTATSVLHTVTRDYSMLLKHFGETARILGGVFRCYGISAGITLPLSEPQNAWSCEL